MFGFLQILISKKSKNYFKQPFQEFVENHGDEIF